MSDFDPREFLTREEQELYDNALSKHAFQRETDRIVLCEALARERARLWKIEQYLRRRAPGAHNILFSDGSYDPAEIQQR